MAYESKIQWTDGTWNPWHGCKKVSPGCKFCYMYRDKDRYGQDPTKVLRSKTKFNDPLNWKEPKLIFTCSWSDWFIEDADQWREEAWEIVRKTPHHTYQILTKRPERIAQCLPKDWGEGYDNVWLGVSTENQRMLEERFLHLLVNSAKVKFLSIEPLISPIDLSGLLIEPVEGILHNPIHWIIVGGESGNETGKYRYRDCKEEWIETLVAQCQQFEVPVFVKQTGTAIAKRSGYKDRHGGDISEWPESIRIRQMPNLKLETS